MEKIEWSNDNGVVTDVRARIDLATNPPPHDMLVRKILAFLLVLWIRMYLYSYRLGEQPYCRAERGEEAFGGAPNAFA